MATKATLQATKSDAWSDELAERIEDALLEYGLAESGDLSELDDLASQVIIDNFVVMPEASVIADDEWIAPGTVFVELIYDPNSDEPIHIYDSYPLSVHFTVSDGIPVINRVEVDVSSFYED